MWNLVLDLLKNKLFSRRWVIQEIALARNVHLIKGQQAMPWFDFVNAISLIMMNSDAIQSIFWQILAILGPLFGQCTYQYESKPVSVGTG
jgi:hypothetical protein